MQSVKPSMRCGCNLVLEFRAESLELVWLNAGQTETVRGPELPLLVTVTTPKNDLVCEMEGGWRSLNENVRNFVQGKLRREA